MDTIEQARRPVLEDVDVVLRDGSTVLVRAVRPDDRDALERLAAAAGAAAPHRPRQLASVLRVFS